MYKFSKAQLVWINANFKSPDDFINHDTKLDQMLTDIYFYDESFDSMGWFDKHIFYIHERYSTVREYTQKLEMLNKWYGYITTTDKLTKKAKTIKKSKSYFHTMSREKYDYIKTLNPYDLIDAYNRYEREVKSVRRLSIVKYNSLTRRRVFNRLYGKDYDKLNELLKRNRLQHRGFLKLKKFKSENR